MSSDIDDIDRLTKIFSGEIPWGTDLSWMSQLSSFLSSYFASRGSGISRFSDQEKGNDITGLDAFNAAYNEYMMNLQNQFSMNAYREDRQWQEDMYNRYQSIPAQVRQMQEAGINPAVMLGGGTPSSGGVSGSSVPQSADAGSSPAQGRMQPLDSAATSFSAVMKSILGMLGLGTEAASGVSGILRNKTMNEKDEAQAELFRKEAFLAENEGKIKSIEASYAELRNFLETSGMRFDNDLKQAQWSKIWSDIDVNNSVIELNGKKYDFMDFQSSYFSQLTSESAQRTSLLVQQTAIAEIDSQKQRALLPYAEQMAKAQLELTSAQGEEATARAQLAFDEACKVYLDNVVQAGMIDRGYIDEKMKQMKKQTKGMTAQNVNTWVNSVATGIEAGCRLAGTIMTGGVAGALPSPTPSANVTSL